MRQRASRPSIEHTARNDVAIKTRTQLEDRAFEILTANLMPSQNTIHAGFQGFVSFFKAFSSFEK